MPEKSMADSIITKQELIDARTDAKTLEEVVNGSETKQVTTRLGENYPSVKKAIKTLFENGGLPATTRATFAELDGVDASEGDLAVVTNDPVANNNTLYVYNGNKWVESEMSVANIRKNLKAEIVGRDILEVSILNGKAVTPFDATSAAVVTQPDQSRAVVVINIEGLELVNITRAKNLQVADDEWRWVATDKALNAKLAVSDFFGTGQMALPQGAAYLVRNANLKGNTDFDVAIEPVVAQDGLTLMDLQSQLVGIETGLDYVREVEPIIIDGATINTNYGLSNLIALGSDRSYFEINVTDADKLIVEGSKGLNMGLDIVFSADGVTRLAYAKSMGNGSYKVPEGAKYAYRTKKFPVSWDYDDDNVVFKIVQTSNFSELSKKQDRLQVEIDHLTSVVLGENSSEWVDNSKDVTAKAQEIIAKSDKPLYKLSDFEGETSEEKIDAALAFIESAGKGILDLEGGTHMLSKAILLPSHCWLYLNNSTIKLQNGVFENIVRNKGIVPNPDPYLPSETLNENIDIRIFGNGASRSIIAGQTVPKSAPNPVTGKVETWTDDNYGWRTIGILFANVKDFQMHDFHMKNLHSWAISLGNGCVNFDVGHIDFYNTGVNGDGVHLVVGCSQGYIHDLTGLTADDTVGITATRDFVIDHPYNQYVYPMAVGGWGDSDRESGVDIHDITIERIQTKGHNQCIRLLVNNGSKAYNITINDINAYQQPGFGTRCVIIGTGWGADSQMGDIKNIHVNNVKTRFSQNSITLDAPLQDVFINNIRQYKTGGKLFQETSKYLADNVRITNAKNINS